MLEAKFAQGNVLRKIVDALRELVNDAKFEFSPTEMKLQSMDAAHVTLVSLLLRADAFESYRCDRALPLGIKVPSFAKVVKTSGPDDAVTLRADDGGNSLSLFFEAPGGGRTSDFEMKLLDLDIDQIEVPPMDYDVNITMPSHEFLRVCRDLSAIGDAIVFEATKDAIKFIVQGDEGSGNVQLRNTPPGEKEGLQTSFTVTNPASASLSLNFLLQFAKATPLSDVMRISMTEGSPICFEYPIGTSGYVRYYLAPKVEDDMQQ